MKAQYKGILFSVNTVNVSFNVNIPSYMFTPLHGESTYKDWKLYVHKTMHNKTVLKASKSISVQSALIEAIWFRNEINKSFQQFNPNRKYSSFEAVNSFVGGLLEDFERIEP